MPFLNGLEFCSTIREILPDAEIIVVTGYDEFEYARRSVELKVSDFLVKPVSEKKFAETIHKAIQAIEGRRRNQSYLESLEDQLKSIMPAMKDRFWEQVMQGHFNEAEISDKTAYYGIETAGRAYKAFIIQIDRNNDPSGISLEKKHPVADSGHSRYHRFQRRTRQTAGRNPGKQPAARFFAGLSGRPAD